MSIYQYPLRMGKNQQKQQIFEETEQQNRKKTIFQRAEAQFGGATSF